MAYTKVDQGDDFDPQVWERGLERETLKRFSLFRLAGKRDDSVIMLSDELSSNPGSRLNFGMGLQWTGGAKVNDEPLEGNELSFSPAQDTIQIGLVKEAYASDEYMTVQRSSYDVRDAGEKNLADKLARTIEESCFNQLAGKVDVTDLSLTGLQSSIPNRTSGYHIWAGTSNVKDEDLASGDEFSIDLLNKAREKAITATPHVRPAWIPWMGRSMYVCFVHPYQARDLRASDGDWYSLWSNQISAMNNPTQNPIISGMLGVYQDILVVESNYVPTGYDTTATDDEPTVRRALFCGAGALKMVTGRIPGKPNAFHWVERFGDYGRIRGIAAHVAYGVKRPQFNFTGSDQDVNSICISSYAVAS